MCFWYVAFDSPSLFCFSGVPGDVMQHSLHGWSANRLLHRRSSSRLLRKEAGLVRIHTHSRTGQHGGRAGQHHRNLLVLSAAGRNWGARTDPGLLVIHNKIMLSFLLFRSWDSVNVSKPLSRPHGPVLFMNQVKRHIAGSGSNEARCWGPLAP